MNIHLTLRLLLQYKLRHYKLCLHTNVTTLFTTEVKKQSECFDREDKVEGVSVQSGFVRVYAIKTTSYAGPS